MSFEEGCAGGRESMGAGERGKNFQCDAVWGDAGFGKSGEQTCKEKSGGARRSGGVDGVERKKRDGEDDEREDDGEKKGGEKKDSKKKGKRDVGHIDGEEFEGLCGADGAECKTQNGDDDEDHESASFVNGCGPSSAPTSTARNTSTGT